MSGGAGSAGADGLSWLRLRKILLTMLRDPLMAFSSSRPSSRTRESLAVAQKPAVLRSRCQMNYSLFPTRLRLELPAARLIMAGSDHCNDRDPQRLR